MTYRFFSDMCESIHDVDEIVVKDAVSLRIISGELLEISCQLP